MKRFAAVVSRWGAPASGRCFDPHGETSIAGSTGETPVPPGRGARAARQCGYTLVELLMATTLTLILMGVVATIFGAVSRSVHESRAVLEMNGRMRAAKARLQLDLEGLTAPASPPRRPEAGEGYLEIVEGPLGVDPAHPSFMLPVNGETTLVDTTAADNDDVLMFTTRARKGPFVGRYGDTTIQAEEAEVIWFVRGRTLYRRVLLVAPQVMRPANGDWSTIRFLDNNYDSNMDPTSPGYDPVDDPTDDNGVVDLADLVDSAGLPHGFHELYDLSARPELDQTGTSPPWNLLGWGWKLNTLGDLTKRENRYAHRVMAVDVFPFDVGRWGQLRLPTLCECSHPWWMTWANRFPDPTNRADPTRLPSVTPQPAIDLWVIPHPWPEVDQGTGTLQYPAPPNPPDSPRYLGPRVAEDVILTNVIGFDVKVWDPGAPLYWAVNDQGTPADLTDDTSISSVIVKPGDPGYHLALAHWAIWRQQNGVPVSGSMGPAAPTPQAYGAYVDLDYSAFPISAYLAATYPQAVAFARAVSTFSGPGNPRSQLARVYDTWSTHYENDGDEGWVDKNGDGDANDPGEQVGDQDMDGVIDEGTDGFDSPGNGLDDDGNGIIDDNDDSGNGIVDDVYETETSPPYPVPLRGIQIQIRTFEPDSRQVRTVTLVMDFVTK